MVAAGSGRRMEGVDKIFSPIAGAPVLTHVLDQLEAFPPLQHIAVVVGRNRPSGRTGCARRSGP